MKITILNLTAIFMGCVLAALAVMAGEKWFGHLNRSRSPYLPAHFSVAQNHGLQRRFEIPIDFAARPIARLNPQEPPMVNKTVRYDEGYCCEMKNFAPAPFAGRWTGQANADQNGLPIYSAIYSVGSDGYRVTPASSARPSRFTIFLGCSFVYGEGLQDDETLAHEFEKASPGVRAYNFAFHGYGPNDLLARARTESAPEIVREKLGDVFYVYLGFHVQRVIGNTSWVGQYGAEHPYFRESPEGKIQQDRDFAHGAPFWTALSRLIANSEILHYFNVDFPARTDSLKMRFFARVLDELRAEYLKRLPGSRFFVVIYPGEQSSAGALIDELERLGIHYLDYSDHWLRRYTTGPAQIPLDGHPSAEGVHVLANWLATDMRSYDANSPSLGRQAIRSE